MIRMILVLTIGLALSGCAALNPPAEYYQAQAQVAALKASVAMQPTQEIIGDFTCNGCSIRSYAPNPEAIADVTQGKGSVDALQIGAGVVTSTVPWVAGAVVAKRVVEGIGDKNYNAGGDVNVRGDEITIDKTDNSVRNETTTKTSVGQGGIIGDNAGDSSGNRGRLNSNDDYTSTPTVVDQPDPVIVQTPDPVVVPAPDPVIVTTPDPVIVPAPDPVIVQQPAPVIVN